MSARATDCGAFAVLDHRHDARPADPLGLQAQRGEFLLDPVHRRVFGHAELRVAVKVAVEVAQPRKVVNDSGFEGDRVRKGSHGIQLAPHGQRGAPVRKSPIGRKHRSPFTVSWVNVNGNNHSAGVVGRSGGSLVRRFEGRRILRRGLLLRAASSLFAVGLLGGVGVLVVALDVVPVVGVARILPLLDRARLYPAALASINSLY